MPRDFLSFGMKPSLDSYPDCLRDFIDSTSNSVLNSYTHRFPFRSRQIFSFTCFRYHASFPCLIHSFFSFVFKHVQRIYLYFSDIKVIFDLLNYFGLFVLVLHSILLY